MEQVLEVTHYGTSVGENITYVQKRFTQIVNQLIGLGKKV